MFEIQSPENMANLGGNVLNKRTHASPKWGETRYILYPETSKRLIIMESLNRHANCSLPFANCYLLIANCPFQSLLYVNGFTRESAPCGYFSWAPKGYSLLIPLAVSFCWTHLLLLYNLPDYNSSFPGSETVQQLAIGNQHLAMDNQNLAIGNQ